MKGFTYLATLFALAVLAGGLALVGESWENAARRDKEAELLFVGDQYRRAIAAFHGATPGPVKRYPRTLEELLKDPRYPTTQRYLRQPYGDPLGAGEWGLVPSGDGGVGGVYSRSAERPLKTAGFRSSDASFEGAQKYSDWKFQHSPAAVPPAPRRGSSPRRRRDPRAG